MAKWSFPSASDIQGFFFLRLGDQKGGFGPSQAPGALLRLVPRHIAILDHIWMIWQLGVNGPEDQPIASSCTQSAVRSRPAKLDLSTRFLHLKENAIAVALLKHAKPC